MSMPFEVFFSYSHEDEDWRKKIEKYLYTLQRQKYIQGWHDHNILAGSEWEREILTRLNTAPIILLLVSQNFIATDFCWGVELQQAMQRHDTGTARVIPILVRPTDWHDTPFTKLQILPEDRKPLSTCSNEDEALLQVAQGIRRVVEQMRKQFQATSKSTAEERTNIPIVKQPWNVPLLRNPFFTGRENMLTRLRANLIENRTMALSQPQAISGLGGVGKTQLALEYAYRHRNDYQAVLWVKASTPQELSEDVAALARILDLPEQRASKQQECIDAIKRWLTTYAEWLLIFDNADDLSLLSDYLPLEPKGHILLTTRVHAMGGVAQKMEVAQMDEVEGVRLLLHRAGLIDQKTIMENLSGEMYQQATTIFHLLSGLPLALDQAGAYIEETHESLSNYITLYHTQRKDLLERRGGIRSDHLPVATTWRLAFQTIEQSNPAAIELIRLCAFLAPDAIPEEMILEGDEYLSPLLQSITEDRSLWNNALADLLKYSLIRRNPTTISLSIHRLLQAVIKDEMDNQHQEEWETSVVRVMEYIFPVYNGADESDEEDDGNDDDEDYQYVYTPWTQNQEYLPHALQATEYIANRAMTFSEAIELLDSVGSYLYDHGQYNQAEPLFRLSLSIHECISGPEHSDIIVALGRLAELYKVQAKYDQAEQLYQRSLAICEQAFGPNHSDTVAAINSLAFLYKRQNKYEQAERFFQRSLTICESLFGPDHSDTADALGNLAMLYASQKEYKQAERLYQRVLTIYEHVFGSDRPDITPILNDLAFLYAKQGKYNRTKSLYKRSLTIQERVLGPDHPDTAKTLIKFADFYHEDIKLRQAQRLYQRALAIQEFVLGPEHLDIAETLENLGALYDHKGKYKEAEQLYRRALTICEHMLGPEHPETARLLNNLAVFYRYRYKVKYEQAESLYQRSLMINEHVFGLEHPDTAHALYVLANLYTDQGKYEQAEPLYQHALAIRERVLGPNHRDTVRVHKAYKRLQRRKNKQERGLFSFFFKKRG